MNGRVDVIIPVYKPDKGLYSLIEMLNGQTVKPGKIILMNTEDRFFHELDGSADFLSRHPEIEIHHISKREFDHAGTRNQGVAYSETPYFLLMTQDAVPVNDRLIENLLSPFETVSNHIALSYGRQQAGEKAGIIENYTRTFNYPEQSLLKTDKDLDRMGIKTFFASNVCAMYRKDIWEALGGFQVPAIFNEDMVFAGEAIQKGYGIYYAADACVVHFHNYSGRQQFKRNFDLGVSQKKHSEIFGKIKSEAEGKRLVFDTAGYLCKKGHPFLVFKLIYQSGCKFLGYRAGKNYEKYSLKKILRYTSNREYWK